MRGRILARLGFVILVAAITAGNVSRRVWIENKIANARGETTTVLVPYAAALCCDGRPTVLLLGDSRLARWTPISNIEPWFIVNRAISGETVSQLAWRFEAEVQHIRPGRIVLSAGINDIVGLSFMVPAEAVAAMARLIDNFAAFAKQANQLGSKIFITTILPPSRPSLLRRVVWSPRTMALVEEANRMLRTQRWPPNATLIDLDRVFRLDPGGYLGSEYRLDTLHLNPDGVRLLQNAVLATLGH